MKIEIIKSDIVKLDVDAVVNAANNGLRAGGGVCGAIFRAAGQDRLQQACDEIGRCNTGSAVITPGFDLKAKYIIHAVGPRWTDGRHNERELLTGAYTRALELAVENGCTSIAFPLISAGIFGYPAEGAWQDAISACRHFPESHGECSLRIVFAVMSDEMLRLGRKYLETT